MSSLANKARELDSTRLITAAMERHYINKTTQMIDDPFGKIVDVLGCNAYIGWYDGLPEKCRTIEWKTVYDKPVIISEFGGGALQGFFSDSLEIWSEDFQAWVYRENIKMFKRVPGLSGLTPWILADFQSPLRQLPDVQDGWNRKGLVSEKGVKKKAFYILREYYENVDKEWLEY